MDHFIIVESSVTHTRKEKPSYFTLHKKEFEPYLDKIILINVEDMPDSPIAMNLEIHQRNAIDRGIRQLQLEPNDILLISDVDEIPDIRKIELLKKFPIKTVMALEQKVYYYNPTILQTTFWPAAKALPYSLYCTEYNNSPNNVRGASKFKVMMNCGWHFSYFGSTEFICNKLRMFSHQEFNNDTYVNKDHIEESIKNLKDMFGKQIHYTYIPIEENTYLPKDIHLLLQWLEDFKEVI